MELLKGNIPSSARWIWTPLREYVNQHLYFRKRFELPSTPVSARIRITADTRYRLYVNGVSLLRGPARGFPHSLPVDELDVALNLRRGTNVIGAHVLSFGISTAQNVFRDRAGFYLEGAVQCDDGSVIQLDSNRSWRFSNAAGYRKYVSRSASQMGFQEHFDARHEAECLGVTGPSVDGAPQWTKPDYDDSRWEKPNLLGAVGVLPWRTLEERGIPKLQNALRLPVKAGPQFEGADALSTARPEEMSNVTALVTCEKRVLSSEVLFDHPDRLVSMGQGEPVTIKVPARGRCAALLLDFGETRFGYPILKLSGAKGGEVFDLVYAEHAGEHGIAPETDDMAASSKSPNESSLGDRLTCREGFNVFEALQPRGFQYLMLVARNVRSPLQIEQVAIDETTYPAEQRGSFSCSDPVLNTIWDTGVRTLRHCMADAFMDSPAQSQEQGWAAARVAGMTSFFALGDSQLYKRGLHLMAQSLLSDGLMFGVVPSERPDCVILDYCLHWVLSLHEYYYFTGEIGVLKEHRATLEKLLSFFSVHAGERGLLGPAPNYSIFLDYAPGLDRGNVSATFNLLYLQALRSAADIGHLLGDSGFANHCTRQANAMADRILLVFASSNHRLLVETVDLRSGEPGDLVSQHATALAVLESILGRRAHDKTSPIADVLSAFLTPPGTDVTVGPIRANLYFRTFVHEALVTLGMAGVALDDIRRTWGYMLEQGAATWWERLPLRPGASRCHAWSTHPTTFLSKNILGLYPMLPGWKRFSVSPKSCELKYAKGKVPTPHGDIEIEWETDQSQRRRLELRVPAGAEALVRNADRTPVILREGSHRWEDQIQSH